MASTFFPHALLSWIYSQGFFRTLCPPRICTLTRSKQEIFKPYLQLYRSLHISTKEQVIQHEANRPFVTCT